MADVSHLDFAPPPEPGLVRAALLALLAHALLLMALTAGIQWKQDPPMDAVQAELWAAVPTPAATPAPLESGNPAANALPTPPTPPTPSPEAVAAAAAAAATAAAAEQAQAQAAIATARAKEKQLEDLKKAQDLAAAKKAADDKAAQDRAKQLQAMKEKALQEKAQREKELREKELRDKEQKEKDLKDKARKETEQKDKEQKEKEQKEKALKDKALQEKAIRDKALAANTQKPTPAQQAQQAQQTRMLEELRQQNIKRMAGMAGSGGTGDSASSSSFQASGPSASWSRRVGAAIRANIVMTDDIQGNPRVEVEIRTAPSGTILSARISQASGVKSWDDAVMRAIDKTAVLPKDTDGSIPTSIQFGFRPKD